MDILFYEYLMHICNNVVRIWQIFCKNKSFIWLLNTHLQNLSKRLSQCHAHDQRNDPSKANAIGLSLGIEAILEIESMSSMYYYYYYYYYRFPFPYINNGDKIVLISSYYPIIVVGRDMCINTVSNERRYK